MRLSALETSEIGNEIGGEIGNKIGRAWVSNTIVGRSPYRTTNPGRRDCSTKGHEISAPTLSPSPPITSFSLLWWILRFLRFSTAPELPPRSAARCWLERSRGCAETWLDKNMLRRADERDRPARCIRSAETEQAAQLVFMKRDHTIAVKPGTNSKGGSTSEIKKQALTFLCWCRSSCRNYYDNNRSTYPNNLVSFQRIWTLFSCWLNIFCNLCSAYY